MFRSTLISILLAITVFYPSAAQSNLNGEWKPFYHGVASGDPLTDRVIIWTRVSPEDSVAASLEVKWKVALDPQLSSVVQEGQASASAESDYTVKVDVMGLQPGTTYYYGFSALGANSLTGRTRTASSGAGVDHLKFAVLNCSNFQAGYFNGYRRVAQLNDLDAVIFLGDYLYEFESGRVIDTTVLSDRPIEPPGELISLADYRLRYSTHRLDTSLVRAHQQHPFIAVWDDHETANNSWKDGALEHDPTTEGSWEDRKKAGKQAYFEWMPIREKPDQSIYRSFRYGDLVELIMLDTRLEGRDRQLTDILDPAVRDPDRTMLGAVQKAWLKDRLLQSDAQWKLIGNQVVFGNFSMGWLTLVSPDQSFWDFESAFLDTWKGYPREQEEILQLLQDNDIDNVIFLTGDIHSAFAMDLPLQPNEFVLVDTGAFTQLPVYSNSETYDSATGSGSLAVEFISPSITTPNFDEAFGPLAATVVENSINRDIIAAGGINLGNPNPHVRYTDLIRHGYFVLDVTADRAQANWYYNPIRMISDEQTFDEAWYTRSGGNHLQKAQQPSPPKSEQTGPAPLEPPLFTPVTDLPDYFSRVGLYPIPFKQLVNLHFVLDRRMELAVDVFDQSGKVIRHLVRQSFGAGLHTLPIELNNSASGPYYIRIEGENSVYTLKGLKLH